MKTSFSFSFQKKLLGDLEKSTATDRSEAARKAWESRKRAEPEKEPEKPKAKADKPKKEPKAEKPQPKGQPPTPEFGPGFGTPKGPVEMFTHAELMRAIPPNKNGERYFSGVNLNLVKNVFNYDPAETGLKSMIVRVTSDKDPTEIRVYQYTDKYKQKQAEKKFLRAERMADHIGPIRDRLAKDTSSKDSDTKAAATIVKIIDRTYMRVGGSKAEERTGSAGASTLRAKHMTDMGEKGIRVQFTGKAGVEWDRTLSDPDIIRNVREFAKGKKGEDLIFPIGPQQVNRYIKEISGRVGRGGVTAKDFRTFHAGRISREQLAKAPIPETMKEAKANIKAAIEHTAMQLGHTPAVCKSKYINPAIIETYLAEHEERLKKAK